MLSSLTEGAVDLSALKITEIRGKPPRGNVDRGRERQKVSVGERERSAPLTLRARLFLFARWKPSRDEIGRTIAFFCTKVGSLPRHETRTRDPFPRLWPVWANTSAGKLIFHRSRMSYIRFWVK